MNTVSEAAEHQALFAWRAWLAGQYPALDYMIHVPNAGKRAPWRAKREGISAGVPDVLILCPCPSGAFCGMAIELKAGKGRVSPEQHAWIDRLMRAGWTASVERFEKPGDWQRVAGMIVRYLGLPANTIPGGGA